MDAAATPQTDAELFLNRELAQIEFNFRVLAQAADPAVPLLERLRYLCIACTNLDEFFEVRVATVLTALEFGAPLLPDRTPPALVLQRLHKLAGKLVEEQYRLWNEELRPQLDAAGVRVLTRESWNARQTRWLQKYFVNEVMPVLSPLGLDPAHPFPRILNKSLNVVVVLEGKDAFGRKGGMAIVRAPRSLPRIIQIPEDVSGGKHDFVFLSAVLTAFVDDLFPGMKVKGAYQFRVTRNSELFVDEDEVENLASALKSELLSRGFRPAVRLEIAQNCPKPIVNILLRNFDLRAERGLPHQRPGQPQPRDPGGRAGQAAGPEIPRLRAAPRGAGRRPPLRQHPRARPAAAPSLRGLRRGDRPARRGSLRPERTRDQADALPHGPGLACHRASRQRRAQWQGRHRGGRAARALRRGSQPQPRRPPAGSRRAGDVRRGRAQDPRQDADDRAPRRLPAAPLRAPGHRQLPRRHRQLYTDIGLMTANPEIGADVHGLFSQLSGLAPAVKLKRLMASPFTLHAGLLQKIEREARLARAASPATSSRR
jgi:polyphosphate kinase